MFPVEWLCRKWKKNLVELYSEEFIISPAYLFVYIEKLDVLWLMALSRIYWINCIHYQRLSIYRNLRVENNFGYSQESLALTNHTEIHLLQPHLKPLTKSREKSSFRHFIEHLVFQIHTSKVMRIHFNKGREMSGRPTQLRKITKTT